MTTMRSIKRRVLATAIAAAVVAPGAGCREKPPEYGREQLLLLPKKKQEVWAVAPAINLSGQREVDPLLQADLLFEQAQQVRGVTVIPVNRTIQVYASLGVEQVQSAEQASLVCDLLGCDALVVPTVTAYDPYNPPKLGASLQVFRKGAGYDRPPDVDPRELSRAAAPEPTESLPQSGADAPFQQAAGVYDAANGTVREAVLRYASGRNDPLGPLGPKEYFVSMDRYCGFVYHELLADLLRAPRFVSR